MPIQVNQATPELATVAIPHLHKISILPCELLLLMPGAKLAPLRVGANVLNQVGLLLNPD
jgi:hypothetical protein